MKQGKYQTKKRRAPLWYYAALLILLGVLGFCIWYLGSYFLSSRQQAGEFEDLAALVEAVLADESICVVGSAQKCKDDAEVLKELCNLFE